LPHRNPVVILSGEEWLAVVSRCTEKQVQCLDLWRRGWGYKTIGITLHIHPTTAKAHIEAGLQHLGYSVGHFQGLR
jgi:DNA-binding CsgD family transcriptional regulator